MNIQFLLNTFVCCMIRTYLNCFECLNFETIFAVMCATCIWHMYAYDMCLQYTTVNLSNRLKDFGGAVYAVSALMGFVLFWWLQFVTCVPIVLSFFLALAWTIVRALSSYYSNTKSMVQFPTESEIKLTYTYNTIINKFENLCSE